MNEGQGARGGIDGEGDEGVGGDLCGGVFVVFGRGGVGDREGVFHAGGDGEEFAVGLLGAKYSVRKEK